MVEYVHIENAFGRLVPCACNSIGIGVHSISIESQITRELCTVAETTLMKVKVSLTASHLKKVVTGCCGSPPPPSSQLVQSSIFVYD